jgi:hypothetical protein
LERKPSLKVKILLFIINATYMSPSQHIGLIECRRPVELLHLLQSGQLPIGHLKKSTFLIRGFPSTEIGFSPSGRSGGKGMDLLRVRKSPITAGTKSSGSDVGYCWWK